MLRINWRWVFHCWIIVDLFEIYDVEFIIVEYIKAKNPHILIRMRNKEYYGVYIYNNYQYILVYNTVICKIYNNQRFQN